jgi:hypothetical protein
MSPTGPSGSFRPGRPTCHAAGEMTAGVRSAVSAPCAARVCPRFGSSSAVSVAGRAMLTPATALIRPGPPATPGQPRGRRLKSSHIIREASTAPATGPRPSANQVWPPPSRETSLTALPPPQPGPRCAGHRSGRRRGGSGAVVQVGPSLGHPLASAATPGWPLPRSCLPDRGPRRQRCRGSR